MVRQRCPETTLSEDEYFRDLPAPGDVYTSASARTRSVSCAHRDCGRSGATMPPCIAPDGLRREGRRNRERRHRLCRRGCGLTIQDRAKNTIINTLSSVDHDCVLGALSQVTAGVTFGGGVRTGVNCFFGIKSAVVPNTTIGDKVQLMAGSLIVSDVELNVVMGGNPARLVKRL